MGHVKDGLHIDIEHLVEHGLIHFKHGPVFVGGASVVDDDVWNAKGVDAMLHQRLHLRPLGDVTGESAGMGTQAGGHAFGRGVLNVGHDDFGTFAHIGLRNAFTETTTCAGDDGNFVLKLTHVVSFCGLFNRGTESRFWSCSFLPKP